MRVSDQERREIADLLSRHFADGRLDRAEFDERMGRAMGAKTHGDLDGLLVDLPPLVPTTPENAPRRRERSRGLLPFAALALFVLVGGSWLWSAVAWNATIWHPHFGFVIVLLVAFAFLRRSRFRHWTRHGAPGGSRGTPPGY
ncbi:MAG TPA: DUF1707 domain-containing protein [Acidimicrobiales bacterium]|nr:DUF1707 domain-containing protein [Acidimicrobiales bacterium]